jgi:hypothetical protein
MIQRIGERGQVAVVVVGIRRRLIQRVQVLLAL